MLYFWTQLSLYPQPFQQLCIRLLAFSMLAVLARILHFWLWPYTLTDTRMSSRLLILFCSSCAVAFLQNVLFLFPPVCFSDSPCHVAFIIVSALFILTRVSAVISHLQAMVPVCLASTFAISSYFTCFQLFFIPLWYLSTFLISSLVSYSDSPCRVLVFFCCVCVCHHCCYQPCHYTCSQPSVSSTANQFLYRYSPTVLN